VFLGVPGSLVGEVSPLSLPIRSSVDRSPLPSPAVPTFLASEQPLARFARPIARFLQVEAAGGLLLVAAAVVALVWANSPWQDSYHTLWSTPIQLRIGSFDFSEDLGHFVNDGLMAIFFFVVGLEIKREFVAGELRDRRAAAIPVIAALGGMIVPACIYAVINVGQPGQGGWGIPMATDIAFAVGALALLGPRVPPALKVFLLTLAIVDDIGAIAVIAVFYSDGIRPAYLVAAVLLVVVVVALRRLGVNYPPVYVALALVLWAVIYQSGVHATIAGVILGLLTPARPVQRRPDPGAIGRYLGQDDIGPRQARDASRAVTQTVSKCERLEDLLHPWTSFVIVPLFALANAGITIDGSSLTNPSAAFVGVVAGLLVGKPLGVMAASWIAVRLHLGQLPQGVSWTQMVGAAILAGIGFTVSLFIADLAFSSEALQADAKLAILVASVVASLAGAAILVGSLTRSRGPIAARTEGDRAAGGPFQGEEPVHPR
jgi:Na+:H+ antiporter, NhaA family